MFVIDAYIPTPEGFTQLYKLTNNLYCQESNSVQYLNNFNVVTSVVFTVLNSHISYIRSRGGYHLLMLQSLYT